MRGRHADRGTMVPVGDRRLRAAIRLLTRVAGLVPVVSDFLLSVEPGARRAVQYVT